MWYSVYGVGLLGLTHWIWCFLFTCFHPNLKDKLMMARNWLCSLHYSISEILAAPSACIFWPQQFCGTSVPLGSRSNFILNRTVHSRTTKRNSEHVKMWAARDLQVPEVLVVVQVFVVDGGQAALVDNVAVRRQKIQGDTGNHTQWHFNTDTGTDEMWIVVYDELLRAYRQYMEKYEGDSCLWNLCVGTLRC